MRGALRRRCTTLALLEFMRVPLPAARMTQATLIFGRFRLKRGSLRARGKGAILVQRQLRSPPSPVNGIKTPPAMPPYLLVIESDPELQQRIGDTLRQAHYELSAETDAAWAKRSLLVRPPDGVILDTHLSDGSGFVVAEELRKDPDTKTVPIFFVASRYRGAIHQAETRRRFAPAEYLTTPLDLDSLLAMVLEMVPPTEPGAVPEPVADYPSGPLTDAAQRRERKVVEATARELSNIDPDLRGSLAYQPFARILQRVYA